MTGRVSLAARARKWGSLGELSAECRRRPGGRGMGVPHLSAYLSGARPIGRRHFLILCAVLRVAPESVCTSLYLTSPGRKAEPVAA